ncbi:Trp biosynthesis-associated membrane protein [Nocardioides sp.]|uniref:Trp biosynthesis-associated membrane protein n=1 Tax=Nocardioides sp. TaxID=35761 RepID=UPI002728E65D|nr:Trp biosynthesis-associated membrane protein [Nocardioides sp.]MDO9455095.1 Trp biosynthesis-associated membrane protein [Nocardioides sp.]
MADGEPDPQDRKPRSTFGPTVLLGLAGGTLAAVAGNQAWVSIDDGGSGDAAFASTASVGGDLTAPPVTATALVLLATWGVVLVTRGRVRRAVAWLGLLAGLAVVGFAVAAWAARPGEVADDLRTLDLGTGRTLWAYVGVVAGGAGLAASVIAVRGVRSWPEMGRRYDAPATSADAAVASLEDGVPPEEQSSIDLWKALDEGRDPTDGPAH